MLGGEESKVNGLILEATGNSGLYPQTRVFLRRFYLKPVPTNLMRVWLVVAQSWMKWRMAGKPFTSIGSWLIFAWKQPVEQAKNMGCQLGSSAQELVQACMNACVNLCIVYIPVEWYVHAHTFLLLLSKAKTCLLVGIWWYMIYLLRYLPTHSSLHVHTMYGMYIYLYAWMHVCLFAHVTNPSFYSSTVRVEHGRPWYTPTLLCSSIAVIVVIIIIIISSSSSIITVVVLVVVVVISHTHTHPCRYDFWFRPSFSLVDIPSKFNG